MGRDGEDESKGNRAQMTCNVSFGPQVSYFFLLLYPTKFLLISDTMTNNQQVLHRQKTNNRRNGVQTKGDVSLGPRYVTFVFLYIELHFDLYMRYSVP
jgi:hypothetical protein